MAWSTSYLSDSRVVLTVYSGVMPPEALIDAVQATIRLGQRQGAKRFLADCRALEGGHSIVDLYGLEKLLESSGMTRDMREALVLPQLEAPSRDVRFWETMCQNRGFDVRVFEAMAEAEAWLAEGPTPGASDEARQLDDVQPG